MPVEHTVGAGYGVGERLVAVARHGTVSPGDAVAPTEPTGERVDVAAVCAGQQDDELVAAGPGEDVGRAELSAERTGKLAEHLVARQVAASVVDGFEPVQVDGRDGDSAAGAACGAEGAVSGAAQTLTVERAGERVGDAGAV